MTSLQSIRELAVFGVVGVLATAIHWLVAVFIHEGLTLNLQAANVAGYLCAVLVSYLGHGLFTFRVKLGHRVLLRFVLASLSALAFSAVLLLGLHTVAAVPHRLAMVVVVCTVPLFSFITGKYWVFKSPLP